MQNNLLPQLEKIVESYKPNKIPPQHQPQLALPKPYEWITKYCSYEFKEGDLICTNSLGKTFTIFKSYSYMFSYIGKSFINNEKFIQLFSKSQFNFIFWGNITIQIHDCLIEVLVSNYYSANIKGNNSVSYVIKSTSTCYEIEILINYGQPIYLNVDDVSELLITEPEKYLTEIIINKDFDNIFREITNFSSENIVVNFNKFKITTSIKPEINKFIISELCLGATYEDVVKLLKGCIEKKTLCELDDEIHLKTLTLIDLVKKREAMSMSRDKFILLSKIKPEYVSR